MIHLAEIILRFRDCVLVAEALFLIVTIVAILAPILKLWQLTALGAVTGHWQLYSVEMKWKHVEIGIVTA